MRNINVWGFYVPQLIVESIFCSLCFYATSDAASARPASPRNRGIRPTTTAVVPVRFAASITSCVTGIAAATIRIVPKITFIIGFPAPLLDLNIFFNFAPDVLKSIIFSIYTCWYFIFFGATSLNSNKLQFFNLQK